MTFIDIWCRCPSNNVFECFYILLDGGVIKIGRAFEVKDNVDGFVAQCLLRVHLQPRRVFIIWRYQKINMLIYLPFLPK